MAFTPARGSAGARQRRSSESRSGFSRAFPGRFPDVFWPGRELTGFYGENSQQGRRAAATPNNSDPAVMPPRARFPRRGDRIELLRVQSFGPSPRPIPATGGSFSQSAATEAFASTGIQGRRRASTPAPATGSGSSNGLARPLQGHDAPPIRMKHLPTCSHCGRPMISVNLSTGRCWECSFCAWRNRSSSGRLFTSSVRPSRPWPTLGPNAPKAASRSQAVRPRGDPQARMVARVVSPVVACARPRSALRRQRSRVRFLPGVAVWRGRDPVVIRTRRPRASLSRSVEPGSTWRLARCRSQTGTAWSGFRPVDRTRG